VELVRREGLEGDVQEWEEEEDDDEDDEEEDDYDSNEDDADVGTHHPPQKGKRIRYDYPPTRQIINPTTCHWLTADLLRNDLPDQWDLVLDKGTFDALCLSQEPVTEKGGRLPSVVYPEQVARLVKEGGYFLITSCNFTQEEVVRRWTVEGLGFAYQ
jgi:hypothetical protein